MSDHPKPIVLIVDDTPSNIHILAQTLQHDYRVKIAPNGHIALDLARLPEKPDLILLDVIMPDLDGYEVCKRLKENEDTKKIPVIFVTARDKTGDEEYGLNLGAVDYITKPFEQSIVRARVRNHIALKLNSDLLESLAFMDGLTRIGNRRRFDEVLSTEWRRAGRNQAPISLILLDIDRFKNYNDHYGHGAGDECLRKVARTISSGLLRPGDIAARYGGEEFGIVLAETGFEGACFIAERIRSSVESLCIVHAPSAGSAYVTVSLGCVTNLPPLSGDPEIFLEAADQLLYQAKQEGRNRVSSSKISKPLNQAWSDS
ncbi:MAG: diguanylate cyclase [Deltaproteobacteria bacterium]|nr:diguanylate cyclase [Deltaproteobacteria bacterium]